MLINQYEQTLGNQIALAPQALSGSSAVNGATIDKRAIGGPWQYGVFAIQHGVSSGSPSAVSVTYEVEDSPDGSTWQNTNTAAGGGFVADPVATVTGATTVGQVGVVLSGCQRYVRLVATPTFTGGTSPTLEVAAQLITADPRYI